MTRLAPTATLIVPRVWQISLDWVNAFLIEDGGYTLIDTGTPIHARDITDVLTDMDIALDRIVVTHYHADHVGSLAELAADGITVFAHAADAAGIRGEVKVPPPDMAAVGGDWVEWQRSYRLETVQPARVDVEVAHGQLIGGTGLRVVHTPGHTPGHITLVWEPAGVQFMGDAAANIDGLVGAIPALSEDMALANASIRTIADQDFDIAVFGHGTPITGGAKAALGGLADSLA